MPVSPCNFGTPARRVFLFGLFFLLVPLLLWADDTNVASPFLDIPSGSRPAAMAGAYAALSDDALALRYNPAGLGYMKTSALAMQHNDWGLDMRQEFFCGVLALEDSSLGLGFTYMSYGSIPERDETGARTGQDMSPTDYGLTLGYGYGGWGPNFFAGTALTLFQESLFGENTVGVSGDLGVKYRWDALNLDTGAVLRNVGTSVGGYSLPSKLTTGLALRIFDGAMQLCMDADWPLAKNVMQVALGGEFTLLDFLAIRLGYRFVPSEGNANVNGFTAGLGLYWDNFGFSYAYQPMGDIAAAHRLTLEYQFDKPFMTKPSVKSKRRKNAKTALPQATSANAPVLISGKAMPALPDLESRSTRTAEVTPEEKKEAIQYYLLGRKLYDERQIDQAIDAYTQALAIYPGFVKARQAMAVAKREKSREFVLKAIKPASQRDAVSEAHRLYENGQDLERKGKWVDAAFAHKSALNLMPRYKEAEAAMKRVQAQVKQKTTTNQIESEITAMQDDKSSKPQAKSAGKEGAPDESVTRAIQKHMLAGTQALDHGDYQEAIREFELIQEFDPEHKQAKYKLDLTHKKLSEEIGEAKQRADGAKQSGDRLEEAKALRAILVLDPNNKNARQAFKEARTKSRKEIDELYKQGVMTYAQGRYTDAIQIWNEVLDLDPEHAKAKESIAKAREKIKLIKEQQ